MLYIDRINSIEQLLIKNNSVSVNELSHMFGVSGQTIRRDLRAISQKNPTIICIYGGAYRLVPDGEPPYNLRQGSKVEEKRRIAKQCIEKLEDGDYLFLDSSTTTLYLAKLIANLDINLTVITNSLGAIDELHEKENIKLICIGGRYTRDTNSFIGSTAIQTISNLYATKAFISCSGIDSTFGITHISEEESDIRKIMLKNSKNRFLLIDSNKFGRCKSYKVASLNTGLVDVIYTDCDPGEEWELLLSDMRITLQICD